MRLVIALQPSPASPLVPAKAGIQTLRLFTWIPACAGMSGAVALVFAAVLIVPASTPASAGGTPGFATHADVSDLSTAGKKKAKKRKAPKKEEYLRAAPSEPPPGARK